MNKALQALLKTLHGWNPALDDKSLAFALKDQNGRQWHGFGSPDPDGFGYDCRPDGIQIHDISGMPEIEDKRFTWLQFVKWARREINDDTKGEETNMKNSIEKQETFIKNPPALHAIEVRIAMHIQEARRNCLEVGLDLCKAKDSDLVPFGRWEQWVYDNTGLSKRQAERLMAAAREVPEGSTLAKLDLSKITEILALPEPEREGMAERVMSENLTVKKLREEIARERKRSDQALDKYNKGLEEKKNLNAELSDARHRLNAAQEIQRRMKEDHQQTVDALQLELNEALSRRPAGVSPEAQAQIDQLTQELADAEAYAEEQARLRQQAQQELLNASVGRGDSGARPAFGPENLEAAVRAFLGEVGVMMYMDTEFATMNDIAKAGMRKQLAMVDDWLRRVQQLMNTRVTVIE